MVPERKSAFLIITVLIRVMLENKISVFQPLCQHVSYYLTHSLQELPGWGQRLPRSRKTSCSPHGAVSLSREKHEARLRGVLGYHCQQGHTAANLQPCPTSAKSAYHSPLPNIYDEAGWGILSLGMHLGFHSGKQVGFVSQKLLRSQFFPETIYFV